MSLHFMRRLPKRFVLTWSVFASRANVHKGAWRRIFDGDSTSLDGSPAEVSGIRFTCEGTVVKDLEARSLGCDQERVPPILPRFAVLERLVSFPQGYIGEAARVTLDWHAKAGFDWAAARLLVDEFVLRTSFTLTEKHQTPFAVAQDWAQGIMARESCQQPVMSRHAKPVGYRQSNCRPVISASDRLQRIDRVIQAGAAFVEDLERAVFAVALGLPADVSEVRNVLRTTTKHATNWR